MLSFILCISFAFIVTMLYLVNANGPTCVSCLVWLYVVVVFDEVIGIDKSLYILINFRRSLPPQPLLLLHPMYVNKFLPYPFLFTHLAASVLQYLLPCLGAYLCPMLWSHISCLSVHVDRHGYVYDATKWSHMPHPMGTMVWIHKLRPRSYKCKSVHICLLPDLVVDHIHIYFDN
jgi:hypothetical protein